jgi:hypothetical protein
MIAALSKIPTVTLKKKSDPKKRIGRGIDIGRLRHLRSETNLAALKKKIALPLATLRRMGFGAGKSSPNGGDGRC